MKRIVSIVGSPSTNNSNTRALIEDFVELVKKRYEDLKHDVIMLGEKDIAFRPE